MKIFLNEINIGDLDVNLFDQLKIRLCCDVFITEPESFSNRWIEIPANNVEALSTEIQYMTNERKQLTTKNDQLSSDIKSLHQLNEYLSREGAQLLSDVQRLVQVNDKP
jgi:uncharacterized protein YoxC